MKIISNEEIKLLLNITGPSKDALIELWNTNATEILCNALNLTDLGRHLVTRERVKIHGCGEFLRLQEFPIDLDSPIVIEDLNLSALTGLYFAQDPQQLRNVNVVDASGLRNSIGYKTVFATYYAGFLPGSVTVASYAALVGTTIKIYTDNVEKTWTFVSSNPGTNQILASVSNASTATNIAAKMETSAAGAVITLPVQYRMELGTATSAGIVITPTSVPAALRACVAFIAAGGVAAQQSARGVSSYTIGGKSVTFRNGSEANLVMNTIEKWAGSYKTFRVFT